MDDLGDLVRRLSSTLRRMTRATAEPHGLNPHQLRALRTVVELDSARPSDVAERLRIAPRSATDVIDGLVTRGLVERRPHPEDRRATLVDATAEGRRVLGEIEGEREAAMEAYFARLNATERTELARLLGRLVDEQE
ncbi:MarR family transcriptional regulator [Mariniluteicoccus endophyticus]